MPSKMDAFAPGLVSVIGVREGKNMKRGPKWSEDSVSAVMVVLRSRIEAIDEMDDGRLDAECGKRVELKRFIGESQVIKRTALKDWAWGHWTGTVSTAEEHEEKPVATAVNLDEELDKMVEWLRELSKDHSTATEGGIRQTLYGKDERTFGLVFDHGIKTGKLKKTKTTGGTEIVVLA